MVLVGTIVNEVMEESEINTDIYKPHCTRAASNTKVYKSDVPLEES